MTHGQHHTTLHDIAFEGRNKAYGAYVLRTNTNRRIGLSLTVSVLAFLLFIYLFYLGMEWIRHHQPVYQMPAVSVGLTNTIPSIFASGIESTNGNRKQKPGVMKAKSPAEFQEVAETAQQQSTRTTASGGEAKQENSSGGTAASSNAGIPWGSGEVFLSADVIPQFEGGREGLSKYLSKNMRYPEQAIDKRLQGTVLVCFVVTSEGYVKDAKIVRGIDPSLDNEALRVVSLMPLWKPGLRAGKPVNIVLTLPIRFDLKLHFSR